MTREKLEALHQQREDAMVRLFQAWIDTRSEDVDEDSYEELENAADAFTLVQEALKSVHH